MGSPFLFPEGFMRKINRIQRSFIGHVLYVQRYYDVSKKTSFYMAEELIGELL